ncbi:hypothetical protein EDEG_00859 [Edhazardia aedis USNM 41457]|uniref:N-acetyltransferase domain-containing protein n=1 Tax=Edhazardia aedis (strain USNM 41457) TaxID=1003232 RepID=J8ZZM5_EDHAE|nr:hypothetical protein EDEG_00859 [Edhazardia aedis USNM 41457]|eukprot:EJW05078.1 hypothetical protein EDEG_00859 [Edhazardia aedis USNM 41457]
MFEIEPMEFQHLFCVHTLNQRNLPENYILKFFQYHLVSYPDLNYVATINTHSDKSSEDNTKTVVGYILSKITQSENIIESNLEAHISSICVDEGFRRQGIAKALVAKAIKSLVDYVAVNRPNQKIICITLKVRESNVNAIVFYEKFGFSVAERNVHYYSDGEDAFNMERKIVINTFKGEDISNF